MPRGGPMGRGGDPTDKAKDFKGAMKRLFSELKPFIKSSSPFFYLFE